MKTWHLCWYVINSGVSHSLTDWGDAWFHRLQNFLFLRAEVTMQWHVIPGSGWQCSAPNKKSKKKKAKTMPSDGARAPLNISNHEVVDNLFYFCFLLSFSPQPGSGELIFFVLSPQMIFVPYLHCVLLFLLPLLLFLSSGDSRRWKMWHLHISRVSGKTAEKLTRFPIWSGLQCSIGQVWELDVKSL